MIKRRGEYGYPRPSYAVPMSPEQVRRQDLQVDWLIAALQRANVRHTRELDLASLDVPCAARTASRVR